MASHRSVTRCDVSAPYRHTVTSRHTPLRGVTDVTCDAGGPDHRFHQRAAPLSHISAEHQRPHVTPSYRYRSRHPRGVLQRREVTDIPILANSIQRPGLIHYKGRSCPGTL
jgi:hypothetical protein